MIFTTVCPVEVPGDVMPNVMEVLLFEEFVF